MSVPSIANKLPPPPALAQARLREIEALNNAFIEGVKESFPTISIKGSKWAIKFQGQLMAMNDTRGIPLQALELVLLNASRHLSKVFYIKPFQDGDFAPPDCWSVDSVRPDPGAPQRQSPTCAGCKQNAFGSRQALIGPPPAGEKPSQAKACQDSRRVVTLMPHDIQAGTIGPIMLRVPQTSLKNLKEYVQNLASAGYPVNACTTTVYFEAGAAYPKLAFQFGRPLTDDEYATVAAMENEDRVMRILAAAVEGPASEELDEYTAAHIEQTPQQYAQPPAPVQQAPAAAPAAVAPVQGAPQSTPGGREIAPPPQFAPPPAQATAPSNPALQAGQPGPNQWTPPPGAPADAPAPTPPRAPRVRKAAPAAPPAAPAAPSAPPAPTFQPAAAAPQFAPPAPPAAPQFAPPSAPQFSAAPTPPPAPKPPSANGAGAMTVQMAPPDLSGILTALNPKG